MKFTNIFQGSPIILISLFLLVSACNGAATQLETTTTSLDPTQTLIPTEISTSTPTATPTPLATISVSNIRELELLSTFGKGVINDLAWSPDGNTVVIATSKGIYLFDVLSAIVTDTVDMEPVSSVAFSPNGDVLALGLQNGLVRLLDSGSLTVATTFDRHQYGISQLLFSPDGELLVSRDYSEAKIWDLAQGNERFSLTRDNGVDIVDLKFTAVVGQLMLTGVIRADRDYAIASWDVFSGERVDRKVVSFIEGFAEIYSPLILANSPSIFAVFHQQRESGSKHFTIEFYQADTLDFVKRSSTTEGQTVLASFSPSDKLMAVDNWPNNDFPSHNIEIYDVGTGELMHTFPGYSGSPNLEFSPNERLFASSGTHGFSIFDLEKGEQIVAIDDFSIVKGVSFLDDSYLLAVGNEAGNLSLHNLFTSETIWSTGSAGNVVNLSFSSEGLNALMSGDFGVKAYELGVEGAELNYEDGGLSAGLTFVNSDGTIIAFENLADGSLALHNLTSGEQESLHPGIPIQTTVLSLIDQRRILIVGGNIFFNATGAPTTGLALFKLDEDNQRELLSMPGIDVAALDISVDEKLLAASTDRVVLFWDLDNGNRLLYSFRSDDTGVIVPVSGLAFSPNGLILAGGDWSGEITVWDMKTGLELVTFPTEGGVIESLTFSADASLLVSVSRSGVVSVWAIP